MAVVAADWAQRWRDMGPALWATTGAAGIAWFLLLGAFMAVTEPRKVDPGPRTLDLGGDEPPAVVNLVASDWRLGHEAMPATLLDLAARKRVAIELTGDRTFVRVLSGRGRASSDGPPLTEYEDMILDHVRRLADQTPDGVVPAEALTTGPQDQSKGWWRNYAKAVESDARDRGLSRARWTPGVHALLTGAAGIVAVLVAVTLLSLFSRLPDDSEDTSTSSTASSTTSTTATTTAGATTTTTTPSTSTSTSDKKKKEDNPITAAVVLGIASWGGLISLVETAGKRQRDTAAGRTCAARWLGLRDMLHDDVVFGDQPPAGVAIWDRHLAYGAALGVAHGAVRALPLGAESDTTAWSPVGGRWRVVRIRYPNRMPPGYGRSPGWLLAIGSVPFLLYATIVVKFHPDLSGIGGALGDALDGRTDAPTWARPVAIGVACVLLTVLATLVAIAAWWVYAGFLDLVTGRQLVQGRVLRYRQRGTDKNQRWYLAVDDGTSNHVRAWRFRVRPLPRQGDTVRAHVSRRLRHVKELVEVPDVPPAATPAATRPAAEAPAAASIAHEMTARGE